MKNQVIFFQGGGEASDYDVDSKLVASLRTNLGPAYSIHYPRLDNDGTPDLGRRTQIGGEIAAAEDHIILVGHSLGASMLLAYLSENKIEKEIAGIFLLATPYWSGREDWVEAFRLQPGFANKLNRHAPIFFYHCHDDEVVPFAQLAIYKRELPWASFREIAMGGHQFNNDLAVVADDIRSI